MRLFISLCVVVIAGCGDDSSAGADANIAGAVDATAGGPLLASCTGDCSTMGLEVVFGATTKSFDRAFFGLSSPTASESNEWEIYIESNAGTDSACPTESSPTPDFLITLGGFQAPTTQSDASASVTLVDFQGELLTDSVFERSSSNTVTWRAADLCIACTEGSENDRDDRMVAFDLDASFSLGTISGHVFAKHCDSLDKL